MRNCCSFNNMWIDLKFSFSFSFTFNEHYILNGSSFTKFPLIPSALTQRPSYKNSFPDQVLKGQNHWSLLQKHFLPPAPRLLHTYCLNSILEMVIIKRKNQNVSYTNFAILYDHLEFLIHAKNFEH